MDDVCQFEYGKFSQHRPQEVMQTNDYHVNNVSLFQNCQFSQHHPQQPNAKCVYFSNVAIFINISPTVCVGEFRFCKYALDDVFKIVSSVEIMR